MSLPKPEIVPIEGSSLVTVINVPMLETGIDYPASTGPFSVTEEMLQEAVDAQADPMIKAPRVKLGHLDDGESPLNDDLQELFETERNSGDPTIGTWQNLSISDDGQVLLGDIVGVPQWFAGIMASAYPARSIEGGAWRNPANNKEYAFCIEACVLLGVAWPGCTSMDDLQELFSEDGPEVTVIEMNRGGHDMTVVAQTNVEDIRRAFYDEFAQGDRYWWWDRAILIEPNEMIVQDPDEGQLYRLPFTVKGDEVEFDEDPMPVKIVYEDQPDKKDAGDGAKASVIKLATLPHSGKVLASNKNRTEAHAGFRSDDDHKEVEQMDPKEIRKRLGLAEDASDEEVFAKLDAANGSAAASEEESPEETPAEETTETPAANEQVAASGEPMQIDPAAYEELKRNAELGAQAAKRQYTEDRDRFLSDAVKAGKFPPARMSHWKSLFDRDPEGTRETIEKLAAGLIPVEERGSGKTSEGTEASAEYDRSWLTPVERDRVTRAEAGKLETPRITVES